ncbi:MAG: hypothetical protein IKE91_01735 [Clostridia bacterium]|nr:hypothetical protein [Clostridia bacterium]
MSNYKEQANVNMKALCTETKFADRKEFLLYIADEFSKAGVRWCLTCSSTMFFRGITTDFHDFDILIYWEDISKALAVVKAKNAVDLVKGDQSHFASTLFNKYKLGSVFFDLFSEWRIRDPFHFTYVWKAEDVETFEIDGVTIKMVSPEMQYVLYAAFSPWSQEKRLKQACMMAEYLQTPADQRPKFEKCV